MAHPHFQLPPDTVVVWAPSETSTDSDWISFGLCPYGSKFRRFCMLSWVGAALDVIPSYRANASIGLMETIGLDLPLDSQSVNENSCSHYIATSWRAKELHRLLHMFALHPAAMCLQYRDVAHIERAVDGTVEWTASTGAPLGVLITVLACEPYRHFQPHPPRTMRHLAKVAPEDQSGSLCYIYADAFELCGRGAGITPGSGEAIDGNFGNTAIVVGQKNCCAEVDAYHFSRSMVLHEVTFNAPKANEALVKTHAVPLQRSPALRAGSYLFDLVDVRLPTGIYENVLLCSNPAGEFGADVTQWQAGDRIAANFMADKLQDECTPEIRVLTGYRASSAHASNQFLVRIPAYLFYEAASTLPCAAVRVVQPCYNAPNSGFAPIKAVDSILVQGTGGVSIFIEPANFAPQFAVAAGATVIVTSFSNEKDKEVLRLTNGRGIFDQNSAAECSVESTRGGSIDVISVVAEPVDVERSVSLIWHRDIDVAPIT
ncbi:hypothetical protein B0H19DRAFT_1081426 [Mycena capillaripes]|nr:hypothetical protein B0H19DRAFT_1081426 [Mycena capillaripes]